MLNLTELLFSATPEQIQKAGVCKTADELSAVAKAEGMEITAEQAQEILKVMNPPSGEVPDDELDNVAGGRTKVEYAVICPNCQYENKMTLLNALSPGEAITAPCGSCGTIYKSNKYRLL